MAGITLRRVKQGTAAPKMASECMWGKTVDGTVVPVWCRNSETVRHGVVKFSGGVVQTCPPHLRWIPLKKQKQKQKQTKQKTKGGNVQGSAAPRLWEWEAAT